MSKFNKFFISKFEFPFYEVQQESNFSLQ